MSQTATSNLRATPSGSCAAAGRRRRPGAACRPRARWARTRAPRPGTRSAAPTRSSSARRIAPEQPDEADESEPAVYRDIGTAAARNGTNIPNGIFVPTASPTSSPARRRPFSIQHSAFSIARALPRAIRPPPAWRGANPATPRKAANPSPPSFLRTSRPRKPVPATRRSGVVSPRRGGHSARLIARRPAGLSTSSNRKLCCRGSPSSTRSRVKTPRPPGSNPCPASRHPILRPHAIILRPFGSLPNSPTKRFGSRTPLFPPSFLRTSPPRMPVPVTRRSSVVSPRARRISENH